jgi:hypothetical protein
VGEGHGVNKEQWDYELELSIGKPMRIPNDRGQVIYCHAKDMKTITHSYMTGVSEESYVVTMRDGQQFRIDPKLKESDIAIILQRFADEG